MGYLKLLTGKRFNPLFFIFESSLMFILWCTLKIKAQHQLYSFEKYYTTVVFNIRVAHEMYGRYDEYDWQVKLMPQGCEVGVIGSIVGRLQSSVLIMIFIIID